MDVFVLHSHTLFLLDPEEYSKAATLLSSWLRTKVCGERGGLYRDPGPRYGEPPLRRSDPTRLDPPGNLDLQNRISKEQDSWRLYLIQPSCCKIGFPAQYEIMPRYWSKKVPLLMPLSAHPSMRLCRKFGQKVLASHLTLCSHLLHEPVSSV